MSVRDVRRDGASMEYPDFERLFEVQSIYAATPGVEAAAVGGRIAAHAAPGIVPATVRPHVGTGLSTTGQRAGVAGVQADHVEGLVVDAFNYVDFAVGMA